MLWHYKMHLIELVGETYVAVVVAVMGAFVDIEETVGNVEDIGEVVVALRKTFDLPLVAEVASSTNSPIRNSWVIACELALDSSYFRTNEMSHPS
mmetsp:Transcript_7636/g.5754  ORF Transcript_7636/g.5754 Transcript_7636/m.5754 type:complete len:95 (+) Transcript_7636:633-917(+)